MFIFMVGGQWALGKNVRKSLVGLGSEIFTKKGNRQKNLLYITFLKL